MQFLDRDVILNQNPKKRLMIAFDQLKTNYTESTAKDYVNQYKDKPISFIVENSRYIFSEPMFGYHFYKENVISNPYALIFCEYENEREKILTFIEENGDNMPVTQKKMYDDLLALVTERYNDTRGTSTILRHNFRNQENRDLKNIVESVYLLQVDETADDVSKNISTIIESTESADLFFSITPYIVNLPNMKNADSLISSNINRFFKESPEMDKDNWKAFCESILILSSLKRDKCYMEAVDKLHKRDSMIFKGLANESIKSHMDELFIEHVIESGIGDNFNTRTFDCYYSTSDNAVNRIFEDDDYYALAKEDNEKFKLERTNLMDIANRAIESYTLNEYYNCPDVDEEIIDYGFYESGTTIEKAFDIISEAVSGNASRVVSDHSTDIREGNDESKKSEAPKAKSVANAVQFKAMDAEAKQLKNRSVNQQRGQEVKNAVKAVANIPANVINGIKDSIKKWDEADDERRKAYIIEPGFRKKAFRNLKLAITYGTTVSVNAAMLPVIFMARHFSKEKNRRIRNELARELDTEIKVCEEKISDASANGDQQEKYKLMRIKSSLEKEALRVKSNSKYI